MRIRNEKNLIGADGRPTLGIHKQPLNELNVDDFRIYGREKSRLRKKLVLNFRLKRWQFMGFSNNDVVFGIAVVGLGFMGNAFAYVFDRKTNSLVAYDFTVPGGSAISFTGNSNTGDVSFKKGKNYILFKNQKGTVSVEASLKNQLFAQISFRKIPNPLSCVTRAGLQGFNYCHKEASMRVEGTILLRDRTITVLQDESFGVLDYTVGYLTRHTFWNWASGGGIDKQGNRIGFNLVQGINDTGYTENVLWINGTMYKTDVIDFQYSDLELRKPWRVLSNDEKINLKFYPDGERAANINIGLIASKFHQLFGRFEGTITIGKKVYSLKYAYGFIEEHYAKW